MFVAIIIAKQKYFVYHSRDKNMSVENKCPETVIIEKNCYKCPETKCIPKDSGRLQINTLTGNQEQKIVSITGCIEPLLINDRCGVCGNTGVHCLNHSPRENGREKLTYDIPSKKITKREYLSGENIQKCVIYRSTILGEE